jgi:hypothetical protein
LAEYAQRPMAPPNPAVLAAIEAGPIAPSSALPRAHIDRLADPTPLEV